MYDPDNPNEEWYDDDPLPPSIGTQLIAVIIITAIIMLLLIYIPMPPNITPFRTK